MLQSVVKAAGDVDGVEVRGVACLMGCEHGCNVAISAEPASWPMCWARLNRVRRRLPPWLNMRQATLPATPA